jgi:hypothetical protein
MMSPEQAGKLLDEVIYERVLRHIDIEALHAFELELWLALQEVTGATDIRQARELIDRALARFREDPGRAMSEAPFGHCELCEEEAADDATMHTQRRLTAAAGHIRKRQVPT